MVLLGPALPMNCCRAAMRERCHRAQDKLEAWDSSKADDPQYMMNMAKKYVIIDTLAANGNECTFKTLFEKADEMHCDVLTAALNSLKRKKAVGYPNEMPLLNPKDNDVVIKLLKPDFDCFS